MEPDIKVRELLCDLLTCEATTVADDSFLFDDLGMTPDDLEEFAALLHEEFDIDIPDVDAEDWETVADVVTYLIERMEND